MIVMNDNMLHYVLCGLKTRKIENTKRYWKRKYEGRNIKRNSIYDCDIDSINLLCFRWIENTKDFKHKERFEYVEYEGRNIKKEFNK